MDTDNSVGKVIPTMLKMVRVAASCKGWSSNWSPAEGGSCTESWRDRGGGPIWDMNMEEGAEECPVSPQTWGGQSHLGTPWPEGWGAERAWGGKETTWCLPLLELERGFSVCQDSWKVRSSASVQLIDSSSGDVTKSAGWWVSSVRNWTSLYLCLCFSCPKGRME